MNISWFGKIGNELLDLVYPPGLYCISCGKITDDSRTYRLCNDCMAAVNWIAERHCQKCGRPLSPNDPGEICFRCSVRESSGSPQSFDKGYACAGYGAVEQSVIFALKYGSRPDIGNTLGEILYDRMVSEYGEDVLAGRYDLVTPVPTHRDKQAVRGYNHAGLMGKSFAKRAGLRYDPEIVKRTRPTLPMKGLSPEAREVVLLRINGDPRSGCCCGDLCRKKTEKQARKNRGFCCSLGTACGRINLLA